MKVVLYSSAYTVIPHAYSNVRIRGRQVGARVAATGTLGVQVGGRTARRAIGLRIKPRRKRERERERGVRGVASAQQRGSRGSGQPTSASRRRSFGV